MIRYNNGNRVISIDPITGHKKRLVNISDINTIYEPYRPESIDVNLSYKCNIGCNFCYLNATPKGEEFIFNEDYLNKIFNISIHGMEIAMNYNEGQNFRMTKRIVEYFRKRNAIPNITINYQTILSYPGIIKYLNAYHYGISVTSYKQIEETKKLVTNDNLVFHIINGIFIGIDKVKNSKLLILGYKNIGRGKDYIPGRSFTYSELNTLLSNNNVIAFDNLAIDQIGVLIDKKNYMGNDGEISFYIDLVYKKYGVSSTSPIRWVIGNKNVIEMFNHVRKERNNV